jgi:hypothetical protein
MAEIPQDEALAQEMGVKLRRARPRIESFRIDKPTIAERIKDFYDTDQGDRKQEIDARLQRYAKYRMWTEGKDFPWEGATDSAFPDMMANSMRLQDTLHNAVMSSRPPVMAKATKKHDKEKEETVNQLLDYQFFVEQVGEVIVGVLAHDFVNEGFFTAYVPWVKEMRNKVDVFSLGPLGDAELPVEKFRTYLEGKYHRAELVSSEEGWDWTITPAEAVGDRRAKKHKASFFTAADGDIEVEIHRDAVRFDGWRSIPKGVQDVLHPARCENLQIPGPSNPLGASHVILRDYPTVDEIKRLYNSGYYDLMTKEDAEKLGLATMSTDHQELEQQKDVMQGHQKQKEETNDTASHKTLTRLMCFDCYDIDGDGQDEDVIWWMILETETILRARHLTHMFPAEVPTRPLAEGSLFPVPGRRYAIGLLEMMEGLHDLQKQFLDQGGDAGTIANSPFGFYRATSNMRNEDIRMAPGEMYPLSDPQRDVNFPQLGNQNQSFVFNMLSLLNGMEERLTNIGDLQFGRVPQGKSSALRTVQGMQTVLSQGDARPERVLRRFFLGFAQIYSIGHMLNQAFLPKGKQFLINGFKEPQKDPYRTIDDRSKIAGAFMFDFSANSLNTSREATKQALDEMMGIYVSELAITLGITDADGAYRMMRDAGIARGQDPDRYIKPPTPTAAQPKIFFEEAIQMIFSGQQPPQTLPAEGAAEHLRKLDEFMGDDNFGLLEEDVAREVFLPYYQRIAQLALQEQQRAALLQAAQSFGQARQQPGRPGPVAAPTDPSDLQNPAVQGGELLDETLPGAGGGANAVAQ